MAEMGVETVIGALRDAQFGPMVMVGLGGVFVEILSDVSFAMAPLDKATAIRMLTRLKGYKMLAGYRGRDPVRRDAVAEILMKLGDLIASQPAIREIDLNPVIARCDGADIVDARIVLETNRQ